MKKPFKPWTKWDTYKLRAKWIITFEWWQTLHWLFPGWQKSVAYHGIRFLEWLVKDSELILDVQAQQYHETADRLLKSEHPEDRMVAGIYDNIGATLHHCAMDVYVSFK